MFLLLISLSFNDLELTFANIKLLDYLNNGNNIWSTEILKIQM